MAGKKTGKNPGAKQRRGLRGKGPTPKAADRPYHVAAKASLNHLFLAIFCAMR